MKKKIAITGGIGSGKSTVLKIVGEMGYPIFSCDEIYKDVINKDGYIKSISKIFPLVIENGVINRKKLGEIVFFDKEARKKLNAIAHPLIMSDLYTKMENVDASLVFAEVPLLFEGGYQQDFDGIIIVQRKEEERVRSVCARDCLEEKDVYARIKTQKSMEAWMEKTNNNLVWVIDNNKNRNTLKEKVKKAILEIKSDLT